MDEPVLTGDPHPAVWDLICLGTGLGETMLAGCVSRVACFCFLELGTAPRIHPSPDLSSTVAST